jgi:cysteinyl-tRNA synthetase
MDHPSILLFDTFSGEKRPLAFIEPDHCRMYCCGPTVYDESHLGHARAAIAPDVLVRLLRHLNVRVTYVRNITDIDDKIVNRAQAEGVGPEVIASRYAERYAEDMERLGMLVPSEEPRVTAHLGEIREMIEALISKGLAYAAEGSVYFRVASFPEYGRLSKRRPEDLMVGARVEPDARKENPADFALWKAIEPGEPGFDSPWGYGRPGWHIECSAMSTCLLGPTFDVHAGGMDLIFPHHENEIAQAQGVHGTSTYAKHWMHNGFVNFAGEKMSKSFGNFFSIREVLHLYAAEALRFFLLSIHYRSGLNLDTEVRCPACKMLLLPEAQDQNVCSHCGAHLQAEELRRQVRFPGLEEADDRVAYVYETIRKARTFLDAHPGEAELNGVVLGPPQGLLSSFVDAMRDDLNTSQALSVLSEPFKEINRLLHTKKGGDAHARYRVVGQFVEDMRSVGAILGLFLEDPDVYLERRRNQKAARIGLDVDRVNELVAQRWACRTAQDWAQADAIRDELTSLQVTLLDGPTGSDWTL